MNAVAAFEVKGWCPGALRPMESGDGLLVRIKPWCGAFTLAQAAGLADIAAATAIST
jgi:precorrin-3B synthase